MTTYAYNTNVGTTASNVSSIKLAAYDVAFIGQSASITATGNKSDAIRAAKGATIVVNGEVFGASDGVEVVANAVLESGHITVEYDAEVAGGQAGIRMSGIGGTILNAGTITGGTAIWSAHGNLSVFNTGNIFSTGISEAIHLTDGGNQITNHGLIVTAGPVAIVGGELVDTIVNNGTIIGGINLLGGDDRFEGAGTIRGIINGGDGNDYLKAVAEMHGGNGNDTIVGLLEGSLFGDAGKDTISGYGQIFGGDDNDTLTGKSLDAQLFGDDGNDILRGYGSFFSGGKGDDKIYADSPSEAVVWGGVGHDLLVGSTAGTRYRFTEAGNSHFDTIQEFDNGSYLTDSIELDHSYFKAIAVGELSVDAFYVGAAATHTLQRIIFDDITGVIWYDKDGSGSAAAVKVAVIEAFESPGTLSHEDFLIIP